MKLTGLAIGVGISAVMSGILIWVVGLFGLGLEVDGLIPAFIAGFAIALIGGVITWLLMRFDLRVSNGFVRFVINALLGAVVLLLCAQILPGLTVNGFLGALVASVAVGIIAWLLSLPLKRINEEAARQEDSERVP